MAKDDETDQAEPAGGGLPVTVTRDVAPINVQVLPNNEIGEKGVAYYGEGVEGRTEGDTVLLDGPTAIALVQGGFCQIVSSVPSGG